MTIRASLVKDEKLNIDYGYMYDVRSVEELMDYWMAVRSRESVEGLYDYLGSKSHKHNLGKVAFGLDHVKTRMGEVLHNLTACERMREKPRSAVAVLADLEGRTFLGMRSSVEDKGQIFINVRGGYFPVNAAIKILETKELTTWRLPNVPLKICRWPGGTHYYAIVGCEDVVVDGDQKWDTYEEAEEAAKKYMKELKEDW